MDVAAVVVNRLAKMPAFVALRRAFASACVESIAFRAPWIV